MGFGFEDLVDPLGRLVPCHIRGISIFGEDAGLLERAQAFVPAARDLADELARLSPSNSLHVDALLFQQAEHLFRRLTPLVPAVFALGRNMENIECVDGGSGVLGFELELGAA